ncbi:hypothetical protein HDV57DRAFT_523559 [Trichoderma longibrachiatum]
MVGAAQYLDDEIDWVLSAVVGKKKQSYIQTHFHEKFGRHLNHNQIRYIKNKYGKDPRFNSPLVNARPPRVAVSPKPGGLAEKKDEGEQDDEDEVNLGVFSRAGPSSTNKVGERRRELRDEAATATLSTRMKRKKSVDESSDLGERLVKKITGSQRADSQRETTATPEPGSRAAQSKQQPPLQQWKSSSRAAGLQQSSAMRIPSSSPLALSLADNYFDTLQTGDRGNLPAQQPPDALQFLQTSDHWIAPVPRGTCTAGNAASFPSASDNGAPDAYMSIYPALPTTTTMEDLYRPIDQAGSIMSQMPVTAQYQLQMPSNQQTTFSASHFPPALPDLAPPPFQHYLEQQQLQHPSQLIRSGHHQQYHVEASIVQSFPQMAVSETQATPNLGSNNLSNWSQMTPPSPYDLPTFTPIISPQSVDFPFPNAQFSVSAALNTSLPDMQPHHHAHPPTSFEQPQQLYIDTQLHPDDLAGTIDPLVLFDRHGEFSAAAVAPQLNILSSSAPANIGEGHGD